MFTLFPPVSVLILPKWKTEGDWQSLMYPDKLCGGLQSTPPFGPFYSHGREGLSLCFWVLWAIEYLAFHSCMENVCSSLLSKPANGEQLKAQAATAA